MKRLLTAGGIALAIHIFLLFQNFGWPKMLYPERPNPRVLNMTLTSLPLNAAPKPDPQPPEPVSKTSTIVKKTTQPEPKRVMTPSPQKKTPIPNQTIPRNITEKISKKTEETFEIAESGSESEKKSTKVFTQKTEQKASTASSMQVIHEARPVYRSNPTPKYPRIARIRGYQGNVLLDVLVGKNGRVHDLRIHKSSGYPILDRAAISTVKYWLFEPGRVGEEKIDMWVRVPIRFELK